MRCAWPALLAASAVIALGCFERSTVLVSTPSSDTRLWELTEAQATQLCTSLEVRAGSHADHETLEHASCLFTAALATQYAGTTDPDFDPRSTCQSVYMDCLADKALAAKRNAESAQQCSTRRFAGCNATVEIYRECQEQALDALGDALGSRTCDDVIGAPDAGPLPNPFDSPECDKLYGLCANLTEAPQPPVCSASIRATGAIDAELMLPSDNCHSQAGRTADGVDWIALSVWSSAHLAVHGLELRLPPHAAPWSERLDGIGLTVWNDDNSVQWMTADGCEGDVQVDSCNVGAASGDRYRVRNGRCADPLPASSDDESELGVAKFSLSSYCIQH